MRKLITGLTSFALLVSTVGAVVPSMAQAGNSDSDHEPGRGSSALTSWVSAVDVNGDATGLSRFRTNENNSHLAKVTGVVTAVSSSSISVNVTKNSVVTGYTFSVSSATKVIRKFKGTATIAEVLVGDTVRVYASSLTSGAAKLIWDKSIWWVALSGKISGLNTTDKTFNLVVTRREPQTGLPMTLTVPIKTNDATIYEMNHSAKAFTDLANDQSINVRGSWNSVAKVVTARKVTIKS